jgi:branched-chain amino acid transport system substrate-binding protein
MNRLSLIAIAGALATLISAQTNAQEVVKIGVVGPKTGPLAAGAAVTHFPNFRLWAHEVNARGGLNLKDGKRKIELIEYDDRTQPGETIKAIERLITQDKADFVMAPYGTGFNLAAAPIFAKHGFPQLAQSIGTDKREELTKRYPTLFILQGSSSALAVGVADVLKKLREDGTIGTRVAMANVGDAFGIEVSNAARDAFKKAGLEIVYDRSYPLGTQDLAPVIRGAKDANPDAFVAWSYPPDTIGLTEQARVEGLNVKAFYVAVGTAFPSFRKRFGDQAENILGAGGVQSSPEIDSYIKRHREVTGVEPDFWSSPMYAAMLQVIEQAIEGVGSLDHAAFMDYLQKNKFKTIIGEIDLSNKMLDSYWSVGQWQGDSFHAVAGAGKSNLTPVRAKSGW